MMRGDHLFDYGLTATPAGKPGAAIDPIASIRTRETGRRAGRPRSVGDEQLPGSPGQRVDLPLGEPTDLCSRIDFLEEERFVLEDVADSGHHKLIE